MIDDQRPATVARRLSRRIAAAVLVAPVLLVAACGGEDGATSDETWDDVTLEGDPLDERQQAELGRRIAAAQQKVPSARIYLHATVFLDYGSYDGKVMLDGEGIVELTPDSPAMRMDLTMKLRGSGSVDRRIGPINVRSDGRQVVVRSAQPYDLEAVTDSPAYDVKPGQWVKLSAKEARSLTSLSYERVDYTQLLETAEGADAGNDGSGHHYNFVTTLEQLSAAGGDASRLTLDGLADLPPDVREADILDAPAGVFLRLDGRDRIMTEAMEIHADVAGVDIDVLTHVGYSQFGVPVHPKLPDDVATL